MRFRYLASADVGDAPVQVNMNAAPGWRQYTLKPLRATGGRWADYEAELTVDVAPNGSGEVQLRGTTNRVGDQIVYFDDVSLEVVGRDPLPKPQPFPVPRGDQRMVTPSQLHTIQCDTSELPLKTAAEELCRFVNERQDRDPLTISRPAEDAPRPGTLVLGTPEDNASLARWTRQGKLSVTERSETVDSYEIAEVDGCVAVVGANPRALVYGAFELEDLLVEHGGLSEGFRSLARPTLDTRLLHPRARGGFGSYLREDFEFIARAGANVGHLGHDWMGEKTLLSFVPSTSPTTPSRCVTCSWVH